jgi:hypothetical protein
MRTSCLAGWRPHCTVVHSRPLLSATYALKRFGNSIAFLSCVAQHTEYFHATEKEKNHYVH